MYIIQILLSAVLALALLLTWKRAKERVIRRREAIGWTLLWIGAAVIVLWPDLTTRLAQIVGVGRGVDLAVYGSMVLLFILVFRLHVSLDKMERTMTKMVRKDALRDMPKQEVKEEDTEQVISHESRDESGLQE